MRRGKESLEARLDRLEEQRRVDKLVENHIRRNYGGDSPDKWAEDQVDRIKELYENNTREWRLMVLDLGTAYSKAHNSFNIYKKINEQERKARQQMKAYILSVAATASLCWISTAVKALQVFNVTIKSKNAQAFFSGGIQEVAKKTGGSLAKWAAANPVYVAPELKKGITSGEVPTPGEFEGGIKAAFDSCCNAVLDNFHKLKGDAGNKTGGPFEDILNRGSRDKDNYTGLSDAQILKKIDEPYLKIKQKLSLLCEGLKESSFYYRTKPGWTPGNHHGFINTMRMRFERAMWAGWILTTLSYNTHGKHQGSNLPLTAKKLPRWSEKYKKNSELQKLKPGLYKDNKYNIHQVTKNYEGPGKKLLKHFKTLKIIKSSKVSPENKAPEGTRQVEDLGWYVSDKDVRKLIAWAENVPQHPYGRGLYNVKNRSDKEMLIMNRYA